MNHNAIPPVLPQLLAQVWPGLLDPYSLCKWSYGDLSISSCYWLGQSFDSCPIFLTAAQGRFFIKNLCDIC